jgi:hypothetical protein
VKGEGPIIRVDWRDQRINPESSRTGGPTIGVLQMIINGNGSSTFLVGARANIQLIVPHPVSITFTLPTIPITPGKTKMVTDQQYNSLSNATTSVLNQIISEL